MKRILLLGGIGEAVWLARRLQSRHEVIYSLAGRGRSPDLDCPVRSGGFGGPDGLADFIRRTRRDLVIDATHPYAARISRHAVIAAERAGIPLWAYRRPPWQPGSGDDWCSVKDWHEIATRLDSFRRPFFTIGLEPLHYGHQVPPHQHWWVRVLEPPATTLSRVTIIAARGPFEREAERELMARHGVDVLVTKNSGGTAAAAKLEAVRTLAIPVVMLERPALVAVRCAFADVAVMADRLGCP